MNGMILVVRECDVYVVGVTCGRRFRGGKFHLYRGIYSYIDEKRKSYRN